MAGSDGGKGRLNASPVARILPTSCRVVGRRFFGAGGRPGPGWNGFGAPAGEPVFACRFLNHALLHRFSGGFTGYVTQL